MTTKTFHKTAVERRRLYIDYDCFLAATEQLASFQIAISPFTADKPLVTDTSFPDTARRRLVMYMSNGKGNTNYLLSLIVQTTEGQTKRDDIGLRVMP